MTHSRVGYCLPLRRIRYTLVGVVETANAFHRNTSGCKWGRKGTCDEDLDGAGMALLTVNSFWAWRLAVGVPTAKTLRISRGRTIGITR